MAKTVGLGRKFAEASSTVAVGPAQIAELAAAANDAGKKPRTLARRSFHCIRHSYNTELANADVPQEIRRKLVGHADDKTNDLYTHPEIRVFRNAIDKLS